MQPAEVAFYRRQKINALERLFGLAISIGLLLPVHPIAGVLASFFFVYAAAGPVCNTWFYEKFKAPYRGKK